MPSNRVKRRIKANAMLDYMATGRLRDPEMLIRESIRRTRDKLRKKYTYSPEIAKSGFINYNFPKLMQKEGLELYGVEDVAKLPHEFNKFVKQIPKVATSKKMKKQSIRSIVNISNAKVEMRQSAILFYLLRQMKDLLPEIAPGDIYICFGTSEENKSPFIMSSDTVRFFIVTPDVFIDRDNKPVFYAKLYGSEPEKRELSVIQARTARYSEPYFKFSHGLSVNLKSAVRILGSGILIRKSKDRSVKISLVSNSDLTSALPSLIVPKVPPITQ